MRRIRLLEEKVKKGICLKGINVDEELHADLLSIMKSMLMDQPIFPEGSLRRLFLDGTDKGSISEGHEKCEVAPINNSMVP